MYLHIWIMEYGHNTIEDTYMMDMIDGIMYSCMMLVCVHGLVVHHWLQLGSTQSLIEMDDGWQNGKSTPAYLGMHTHTCGDCIYMDAWPSEQATSLRPSWSNRYGWRDLAVCTCIYMRLLSWRNYLVRCFSSHIYHRQIMR